MVDGEQQPERRGIWALDWEMRKATWDVWETAFKKEATARLTKAVDTHNTYARRLSALRLEGKLSRMHGARVVGCTTTGAAIHHALLNEAGCGVVMVEEAAEVVEAHVLTALQPFTKHLIMIGETGRIEQKRGWCCRVQNIDRVN